MLPVLRPSLRMIEREALRLWVVVEEVAAVEDI